MERDLFFLFHQHPTPRRLTQASTLQGSRSITKREGKDLPFPCIFPPDTKAVDAGVNPTRISINYQTGGERPDFSLHIRPSNTMIDASANPAKNSPKHLWHLIG